MLEQNGELTEAGAAADSELTSLNRNTTNTTKELWNSDYSQEVDATLDHRLLTEDGHNQIKRNAQDSYEFGEDIARATSTILAETDLNVTKLWTTLTNNVIGTQIKNELTRNPEYAELLTALQTEDPEIFAPAFKELGFIAQSKFGLSPDQFGDIFLYDGNATTSTSLGNTLFADTKGGTVIDSSHAEYGNIAVNAAGGVKTDLINTLGHETIEVFALRTGGADDAAQEAQARAFGAQLADRINQAAGGNLDSTSGSAFSASLQNSYAVTQGTIRANTVGSAQVDHRRLRVAETETLERTRAAINNNTSLAPEEKEIAQLQLNALACSAVKCANGVPKDDPLYGQLLALQSAGETLNQQGTSLDSILGEEAGGQFEYGLKTRFDDLLTSQDEMVVRAAGAGQATAGALGMVGGITMATASAAGCVPSAGLSCAGVLAGSAITVLSLEQGRAGLDTAFGAYHHTEGQAVSNSFATETHQGDHNPSLDLAIDVGIAATELVAAKLGTKYLEKALDGKVVKSEFAGGSSSADGVSNGRFGEPAKNLVQTHNSNVANVDSEFGPLSYNATVSSRADFDHYISEFNLTFKDGWNASRVYDEVINVPHGSRPDPSTYLANTEIDAHFSAFDKGAVRFTSRSKAEKYGTAGSSEAFVLPKTEFDRIVVESKGDLRQVEKRLGLDQGYLGDSDTMAVYIHPQDIHSIRIPSGNENGANGQWIPGGRTNGGVPEAVIDLSDAPFSEIIIK